jgi:lactate dehydrogenase-like 2-hydroxyacid dehydrogenase
MISEKIVVLDMMASARAEAMRSLLPPGMVLTHGMASGDEHMKEIIADADYAIAGQVAVSGEVLRAARKLKLLHKWGVGVDNIDLDAARERGIKVARTTGSNAVPVAEFALGLTLAALRGIAYGNAELKKGEWRGLSSLPMQTYLLSGKTFGIIGFGAIGKIVARIIRGFGCTVLYNKRNRLTADEEAEFGATYADVADLLARSDVVSLNCPLTPQTKHLINKASLQTMKKTAVLINVARGGVVQENDLVWALRNRIIHSAAMDVFEIEPLPADSPLLQPLDNLIVTPHLAAIAVDVFETSVQHMMDNITRVSRGEPVPDQDSVV